jgi:hypothetical protein
VHGGVTLLTITARSSHPTEVEMCWLFIAFRNESRSCQCERDIDGSECGHAPKSEISDRGRSRPTPPDSTRIVSLSLTASHRKNAPTAGQVLGVPSPAYPTDE